MRKVIFFLVFTILSIPVFAQADVYRIAPGAEAHLAALLNKPAMVKPATAVPLGKNWFTLETDAHVFTDQVSVSQVAAVLLDIENLHRHFDGKKSKITAKITKQTADETIADFVSIAIIPGLNIKLNTPYHASVKATINTGTKFAVDIIQILQDSKSNGKIKNLYAPRYAEEVTINGKKYTYIRMYTIDDVDASILPFAKSALEKNSAPAAEEAIDLLIAAAKSK